MSGPGLLVLGIAAGIGIFALRKLQAGADATRTIDSVTGENGDGDVYQGGSYGLLGLADKGKTTTGGGPFAPTIEHISTAKKRAQKKHEMVVGGPRRHKIPTIPTQATPIAGLINNHD
jgi:hypothetical protein